MHAHERTMLAKLGFADPDRRQPLHDLACQYLATPDAVGRLVKHLGIEHGPVTRREEWDNTEYVANVSHRATSHKASYEREIAKGHGQYRTTIGFADLVLSLDIDEMHTDARWRQQKGWDAQGCRTWSAWQTGGDVVRHLCADYGVEVKITPAPTSDVIRQVKLYRSYSGIKNWIVATRYGLSSPETQCLRNERIVHVRLGAMFDQFAAQQQAAGNAANVEV